MREYNNHNGPSVSERLSALRSPMPESSQHTDVHSASRVTIRRELLIGGLLLLVVVAILFPVLTRGQKSQVAEEIQAGVESMLAADSTDTDSPNANIDQSGLVSGEAYIALPVESGHFPPQLKEGHVVRISLTSDQSGETSSSSFSSTATVQTISSVSDVGSTYVVTVLAPEELVDKVAASDSIDLAIVGEVAR